VIDLVAEAPLKKKRSDELRDIWIQLDVGQKKFGRMLNRRRPISQAKVSRMVRGVEWIPDRVLQAARKLLNLHKDKEVSKQADEESQEPKAEDKEVSSSKVVEGEKLSEKPLHMRTTEVVIEELRGKSLNEVLRGLRASRGLTQKKLVQAALPDVSLGKYKRWESGKAVPPISSLDKIIEFYENKYQFSTAKLREIMGIKSPEEALKQFIGQSTPDILRGLQALTETQKQVVAAAAGVSVSAYDRWLAGAYAPPFIFTK